MSDPKKNASDSGDITKKAELALKAVGTSAILIAVMGWPAVSLHFARYGIPSELSTMESAIRAGILPALTLILVFGYLWYVRREIIRTTKFSLESEAYRTSLFLFHAFPLGVVSTLAINGGLYCAVFWIIGIHLIWFGLSVEPWNIIFIILLISSLAITACLIIGFKRIWIKSSLLTRLYFSDYFTLLRIFLGLYFIYKAITVLKPNFANPISLLGLLVIAAFLGMSPGLITIGLAVRKGESEIGLHNLQASTSFAIFATFLAVLYYSVDVYPILPKSLGGGRPNAVDVWLDDYKLTGFEEWRQAKAVRQQLHLKGAYLIRLDKEMLIVVDQPQPPGRWAIFPRSSVALLRESD